ncbi:MULTISPECIES: hypothetical protein [Pseudanabaena]|uniref:Uncharacterized protein n=2 Tax=Pseudanabaena TaxID=1152 RepID=L8MXN3_9CYAN|nr:MULTISPECIES: hypothetical protein [Pseudanabaena]ELS32752.1 hypothetical protein Pse7429DRAFT_2458 [Pseudanabaena biceps PCC 7429]MDG3495006.1 hypothetical protein [Pseudanabaena catenata USMAC16]
MSKIQSLSNIDEPFKNAPPEIQRIVTQVIKIEKDRLDKNELGRINEDILKIVKEAVQ